MINRKLVRPNLAELKEKFNAPVRPGPPANGMTAAPPPAAPTPSAPPRETPAGPHGRPEIAEPEVARERSGAPAQDAAPKAS